MITVSTTSEGEARVVADLFRVAPAWLDWRVYRMGTQVASSADQRAVPAPEPESQEAR